MRIEKIIKIDIYFSVSGVLVSLDVPKMSAISVAVFFEAENGHDN